MPTIVENWQGDIRDRLVSEISSWHGPSPWAAQGRYRPPVSRFAVARLLSTPRAWVAMGAASAALLGGGGVALAAASPAGFTVPGTGIKLIWTNPAEKHTGAPIVPPGQAAKNASGSHGASQFAPGHKTAPGQVTRHNSGTAPGAAPQVRPSPSPNGGNSGGGGGAGGLGHTHGTSVPH